MVRIFQSSSDMSIEKLIIEEESPNCVSVYYLPSVSELERASLNPDEAESYRKKILYICGQDDYLIINPIWTFPDRDNFLKPKYSQIHSIRLDGFGYETPETPDEVLEILEDLPAGFLKNYEHGLGLRKAYHFIIEAIGEILQDVNKLVISKKDKTEVSEDGTYITMNFKYYDEVRKKIRSVYDRSQKAKKIITGVTVYNAFANFLDKPKKTYDPKNDDLKRLIASEEDRLSKSDQKIVINLLSQNAKTIAEECPEKLVKLRNDIELVTLEGLINKFKDMLDKNPKEEEKWQKLFNNNPFILSQAFGYPIIKVLDQAHVGGRKLTGSGGKITDFLFKHQFSNNAAICEIKTPSMPLLKNTEYRGGVYTPSSELAGSINQMLDQQHKFQKEISAIKDNSRTPDLESYSVHCLLVAGKTPEKLDQQRSFELFRGNSKNVTILTFDELLEKLKLIHTFLIDSME